MLGPSIYLKKKQLFWYFSETNFQNTFWQDYLTPQKHVLIYSNIYTNLVSSITKEILIWLEKKNSTVALAQCASKSRRPLSAYHYKASCITKATLVICLEK